MKNTVRKTIKKEAKTKPKKTLAIALLLMILIASIIIAITYFITNLIGYSYNIKIINDLIIGIILILMSPFFLSFTKMSKKICSNKETNPKEIFSCLNDLKYIKIFAILIIMLIFITWLIGLIPTLGIFINLVILIFYLPILIIIPFVYLENPKLNIKENIFKTENIVSGNRIKFYGLIISFIFWIILTSLTFGLLSFYVIPYLYISLTLLYSHFTYERDFKREKSLSDGTIIIIFITISLILISFLAIKVPESKIWFKTILNGEIDTKIGDASLIYGSTEVTYDIPEDYKSSATTDTSKTYIKDNSDILQYSIYLSDVNQTIEMDKEIAKEMKNSENYKNVEDRTFTIRKNGQKIKGYQYSFVNGNQKSNTIMAYYPKGNFTIVISLSNNEGKEYNPNDIKKLITIY